MSITIDKKSISFVQDMDKAIFVMRNAGRWLQKSGKNPSKWWQLQNLNREFLLYYAKPQEFYVAIINGKLAAAEVIQMDPDNNFWKNLDKNKLQPALYVHWLCVHRDFAGMNLPRIMIDFVAQKALENNRRLIRVDTDAQEMKLRKIYEDLGFKLIKVIEEDYRKTAFYQNQITFSS